ncbi:MAG: ABC transporter ATP-binding protein [Devosia sp.]|nr:ABC transporter ATP-binding protein [Devosia sp.]
MNDLLTVENVRKSYVLNAGIASRVGLTSKREFRALDGVSLSVAPREVLGLVGESGSGKTTLARSLVRLVDAEEGRIAFEGEDVLAASGEALRSIRRRMQLIYQDPYSSLNPRLRVGDAISEAAHVHGFAPSRADREQVAVELLEAVGLSRADLHKRPREMSGGQRQRVAIARALAVRPDLLIADEAVSALDVSVQAQILNLFAKLTDERQLAMIFITHQLAVVAQLAQRVAIMYLGRIVETGATAEVFPRPGHPYTAMLLRTHPSVDAIGQPRAGLRPSTIPPTIDISRGCRFRNRCPLARPICEEIDPPAVDLDHGHSANCHFAADVAAAMPTAAPVPA